MSDIVEQSRQAREKLATALSILQAPEAADLIDSVAEHVAKAMGALHQIESSKGDKLAEKAPTAQGAVRDALAALQTAGDNAVAEQAMEHVAGSLGLVHGLAEKANAKPEPAKAEPKKSALASEPAPSGLEKTQLASDPAPPAPSCAFWRTRPNAADPDEAFVSRGCGIARLDPSLGASPRGKPRTKGLFSASAHRRCGGSSAAKDFDSCQARDTQLQTRFCTHRRTP